MQEERLLERLRVIARHPERRSSQDIDRLHRSILSHLQRVLNTRQGSVQLSEDFGMPDFTHLIDHFGSEAPREIERTIKQVIQTYEPRLTGIGISFVPREEGALAMRFQITARLAADENVPVVFNTVISGDGQISVSG